MQAKVRRIPKQLHTYHTDRNNNSPKIRFCFDEFVLRFSKQLICLHSIYVLSIVMDISQERSRKERRNSLQVRSMMTVRYHMT